MKGLILNTNGWLLNLYFSYKKLSPQFVHSRLLAVGISECTCGSYKCRR